MKKKGLNSSAIAPCGALEDIIKPEPVDRTICEMAFALAPRQLRMASYKSQTKISTFTVWRFGYDFYTIRIESLYQPLWINKAVCRLTFYHMCSLTALHPLVKETFMILISHRCCLVFYLTSSGSAQKAKIRI